MYMGGGSVMILIMESPLSGVCVCVGVRVCACESVSASMSVSVSVFVCIWEEVLG